MKNEPLIIERTYDAPVEKVWKAITDKNQMKQWYFDLAEFRAEVGFEFQFTGGAEGGKQYLHRCRIIEVIPGRKLAHTWRYEGYTGDSVVTWELFPEGEKTRVKLTHDGLDTFPKENPDLVKKNFIAGWTGILGVSLKEFVEVGTIRLTVSVNASPARLWDILVKPSYTNQWANEFLEGAHVVSDFSKGAEVNWYDKDRNLGVRGVVLESQPGRLLKVGFYDDLSLAPPAAPGKYSEAFRIEGDNGMLALTAEAGPLSLKEYNQFLPLWNKALARIKTLAEN